MYNDFVLYNDIVTCNDFITLLHKIVCKITWILIFEQCGGKNIRFVVMNNILSSDIVLSEKFDLKGSTYKRKASKNEKSKPVPTLKDLDFAEIYPDGIILEPETYDAIVRTLDRDCRVGDDRGKVNGIVVANLFDSFQVLESFKIMDYSLLMGVHNLDSPSTSIVRFNSLFDSFAFFFYYWQLLPFSRSMDNLHL